MKRIISTLVSCACLGINYNSCVAAAQNDYTVDLRDDYSTYIVINTSEYFEGEITFTSNRLRIDSIVDSGDYIIEEFSNNNGYKIKGEGLIEFQIVPTGKFQENTELTIFGESYILAQTDINSLKGDVNLDGIFSISDLVVMQNFLLGRTYFEDSEQFINADYNSDKNIDVFDEVMMRQDLIQIIKD
jgi:hypothetical protein